MNTLEVTTNVGCSVRCSYCPQDILLKAYQHQSQRIMSLETFKTCINNTPEDIEICFLGMSEPWLNPYCTDMILYANSVRHLGWSSTTLTGMTLEDLSRIKHIPFYLSIHVPSDDDKMPINVNAEYLNLLDAVLNSMAIQPGVMYFGKVHPQIEPLLKNIKQKGKFGGLHNRASHLEPQVKKRTVIKNCYRLKIGVLLPNGDVALCCNDYSLKHVLGNLLKQDWDSLYKGKEFQKILQEWKNSNSDILCWQCWDVCTDLYMESNSFKASLTKLFNFLRN